MDKVFSERPNRADNVFVGIFQLAMGLFLLLPFDSFAPTLKFDTVKMTPADPMYSYLTENMFAAAMIILGAAYIFFAITRRWNLLRKAALPAAVFWVFVTIGYAITLPKGTAMVTFSFFTIWIIYQFLELSYWVNRGYLPNKENIGII
jgi:hypothetical protein